MALQNLVVFEKDPKDSISKRFKLQIDDLSNIENISPFVYVATKSGQSHKRTWAISGSNLQSTLLTYSYSNTGTYPTITWRFEKGLASTYYAIIFNVNQTGSYARHQSACIVHNIDVITGEA